MENKRHASLQLAVTEHTCHQETQVSSNIIVHVCIQLPCLGHSAVGPASIAHDREPAKMLEDEDAASMSQIGYQLVLQDFVAMHDLYEGHPYLPAHESDHEHRHVLCARAEALARIKVACHALQSLDGAGVGLGVLTSATQVVHEVLCQVVHQNLHARRNLRARQAAV